MLLCLCVLLAGSSDVILIEMSSKLFTAGFNLDPLDSMRDRVLFAASSIILDLALVTGAWVFMLPVAGRIVGSPAARLTIVGGITVSLILGLSAIRYQVVTRVGDLISLQILNELTARDPAGASLALSPELAIAPFVIVLLLGLIAAMARGAIQIERRYDIAPGRLLAPRARKLVWGVPPLMAIGILLIAFTGEIAPSVRQGLDRKLSGFYLKSVVAWLTDFDRDGYSWLTRIPDPAPFDGSRHYYAIDIPDNGIDENSLAGDLPAGFPAPSFPTAFPKPNSLRRHFLLIYLESFRDDLVGGRHGGQEITPFLNRLAREGVRTRQAYAHSPYTTRSRGQLFGGTLTPEEGQKTLIHDFKAQGYRVGYFSGQDDSFGDSEALIGTAEADFFYDARQDTDRRTSRSTHPASLQVSWKTLLEHTLGFLEDQDLAEPLFLYVNIVDTHYPYHHAELDSILNFDPVDRGEINRKNVEQVWLTYINAAAGVDRAIERVVEAWWERVGKQNGAILITADHGQAFYEEGFLGHGADLDLVQTRVPLVLWGMRGEWPEPVGVAELRGLILSGLGTVGVPDSAPARFVYDARRAVFQYLPTLKRPEQIALRYGETTSLYDFKRQKFLRLDSNGRQFEETPEIREQHFAELIHGWEALRVAATHPPR